MASKRKSSASSSEKVLKKHLEKMNLHAAGIDVGAKSIFVAVPEGSCVDEQYIREFKTFTSDLNALAQWLKKCKVNTVAMESTGVYGIPS